MDQVPIGLPSSILPSNMAILSQDATSQYVRVQPNNLSSISSTESAAFSNSTSAPNVISFPSTPIQFTIPSGSGPNTFIDHSKSSLQFRVRYFLSNAASTGYSGMTAYLQGSAYSWFNRMTESVNGQTVDDRVGLDLAANSAVNWSYSVADRDVNVLNLGLRGEDGSDGVNATQGHSIPILTGALTATGSNYFSYAVPLKSAFIGCDANSMAPISRIGKYDITLYTPSIAPITILNTGGTPAGVGAKLTVVIDQINIELFYLSLDQKSASLLPSPSKPWAMSGVTTRVGSGTIAAGVTGSLSVQVPLRVKSARSLSTRFVDSVQSTVGSVSGAYDSKCPLVSSMNYLIAGTKRIPNVPHSSQFSLANIFNHTLQAYYDGGVDRLKAKCGLAFDSFACYWATGTAPTSATNFDQQLITATSTSDAASQAGFEFAEDLRLASTTFLNGTDLTNSNSYLEMNVLNAPSNTQYVTFIAKADILFIVLPDGNVEVRV